MWAKVALASLVFGIASSNTRVHRESHDFYSPLNNDNESASGEDSDAATSSARRLDGINRNRPQNDLGLSKTQAGLSLHGGHTDLSFNLVESITPWPVTLQEIQTDIVMGQKTSIASTSASDTTSERERTRAPIKNTPSITTSAASSSVGSSQLTNAVPHFGGSLPLGLSKSSTLSSSSIIKANKTSNPIIVIPFPNLLTSPSYSRVRRNALATVVPQEKETSNSSASSTLLISSSSTNNGSHFSGLSLTDSSKRFVPITNSFFSPQAKPASRLIAIGQPVIIPITTNSITNNLSSSANSSSKALPLTEGALFTSGNQIPPTPSFSPLSSVSSLPSSNAVSRDGLPSAEGSTDTIVETPAVSTISQPKLGPLASTSTTAATSTTAVTSTTAAATSTTAAISTSAATSTIAAASTTAATSTIAAASIGNASMNVADTGKEKNMLPVGATLPFSSVDTSSTDFLQPRSAVSRLGSALPTGLSQTTSSSSVSMNPSNPIIIIPLATTLSSSVTSPSGSSGSTSSSTAGTAEALRVGQPVLVPATSAIIPTIDSSTALPSVNLQPDDKTTHTRPAIVTALTSSAMSLSTSTSSSSVIEKDIKTPTENTTASFSSSSTTAGAPVVANSVPEFGSSSTPVTTINGSAQPALGIPVSSALTSSETSTLSTRAKTDVFSTGSGKKTGIFSSVSGKKADVFSSGSGKKADVFSSGSGSSKTLNVGTAARASSDTVSSVSSKSFSTVSTIGAASTEPKTLPVSRSSSSTSKAAQASTIGTVDEPEIVTPSALTSRQGLFPASSSFDAPSDLKTESKSGVSLQGRTSTSALSPVGSLAGISTSPNAGHSGNSVGSSPHVISASLSEQQTQVGNVLNFPTHGGARFFGTVPPSSIANIAIPIGISSVNAQPRTGAAVGFGNNAPLFFSSIPTVQPAIQVLPNTPTGFLIGGQNTHAIAHGQNLAIGNPLTLFNVPGHQLTGFRTVHG